MYAAMDIGKRFWAKVQRCEHGEACATCCWPWHAGLTRGGYGYFFVKKRQQRQQFSRSNRMCWRLTYGDIPQGLHVLHRCDRPGCCNPRHLFLGTHDDNQKDSMAKGRRPTGEAHGTRLHPESVRRGENNHYAKLTTEQVYAIRALRGHATQGEIARQFGISGPLVGLIHQRRVWKHLPERD